MPNKFPETDKFKWLALFEKGRTEKWIARKFSCDPRTIRTGIEEARRKQDVRLARAELIKEALRKHQDALLEDLEAILTELTVPSEDYSPLLWSPDSNAAPTIFDPEGEEEKKANTLFLKLANQEDALRKLLRQHLKNDKLWKVLAQRKKAHIAEIAARIILQYRVKAVLEEKTGYQLTGKADSPKPFLYSYTAGDLFYKEVLRYNFHPSKSSLLENELLASPQGGDIRFRGLILAEAPGQEEIVKGKLLEAWRQLKGSPLAAAVIAASQTLQEVTTKARQIVTTIQLLGLVPGQCDICRRLGV